MSRSKGRPHFSLDAVQDAVRKGRIAYVGVRDEALAVGCDETGMRQCIIALTPECFHRATIAQKVPYAGVPLDVYKTTFRRKHIYIKFHFSDTGWVSLTSFKKA